MTPAIMNHVRNVSYRRQLFGSWLAETYPTGCTHVIDIVEINVHIYMPSYLKVLGEHWLPRTDGVYEYKEVVHKDVEKYLSERSHRHASNKEQP